MHRQDRRHPRNEQLPIANDKLIPFLPSCVQPNSVLDWVSGTTIGQLVLLRVMRTLHTFELTAMWMWPDDHRTHHSSCPPECEETHGSAPKRQLHWFIFLPTIVAIRFYRFARSAMGQQGTVVAHLQSVQRRLRIVRYEGLRKLSSRQQSVLQSVLHRLGWANSVQNLNESAIYVRAADDSGNIEMDDDEDDDGVDVDVDGDELMEDLLQRSFDDSDESDDSDYEMPTSGSFSDSDSEGDSEIDSDDISEEEALRRYINDVNDPIYVLYDLERREQQQKQQQQQQQQQKQQPKQQQQVNGKTNGTHKAPEKAKSSTESLARELLNGGKDFENVSSSSLLEVIMVIFVAGVCWFSIHATK